MTVVADTSPLNYLILIDEVELLPALFAHVLLPRAAFQELLHDKSPLKVREWMVQLPPWLEVRDVASILRPELIELDPGERQAIQLAIAEGIETVLLDDADGRRIAESLRLEVRGTLGVLERGAKLGLTNFRQALEKLGRTTFRMSPALRAAALQRNP